MFTLWPRAIRNGLNIQSTRGAQHYRFDQIRALSKVRSLPSWNLDTFRIEAFKPALPHSLPALKSRDIPAIEKWFEHTSADQAVSSLNHTFWARHGDSTVPLEVTQSNSVTKEMQFEKIQAPLSLLFQSLNQNQNPAVSVYLAQHSLPSLPSALQEDLPTPDLVLRSGKGDIYDSSLWLGRAPTYTPLHRDPNPNIFLQIAGQKVIRLFRPEVGDAVFELVRNKVSTGINGRASDARFRGDEMMQGAERRILEEIVWADVTGMDESMRREHEAVSRQAYEVKMSIGEALFIPQGWWHSVKGVGEGVVGSVNWWFR